MEHACQVCISYTPPWIHPQQNNLVLNMYHCILLTSSNTHTHTPLQFHDSGHILFVTVADIPLIHALCVCVCVCVCVCFVCVHSFSLLHLSVMVVMVFYLVYVHTFIVNCGIKSLYIMCVLFYLWYHHDILYIPESVTL
jgi:hypothetical protein